MNSECGPSLVKRRDFSVEFQIKDFTDPAYHDKVGHTIPIQHPGQSDIGVHVTIFGKGRNDDEAYAILEIEKFGKELRNRSLKCSFFFCVVDVRGEKKFPLSFQSVFRDEIRHCQTIFSQRYVERSLILNNATEYLQEDTLTIIVEGTLEEWAEFGGDLEVPACSQAPKFDGAFEVTESPDLKVYLRRDTVYAKLLMENSTFFRVMWNVPMRECLEERVLLRNEELPALLNVLVFIYMRKPLFYNITPFDLYKISDKYDIPILLEESRKNIKKFISIYVSEKLRFLRVHDYSDTHKMATDRYFQKQEEYNPNGPIGSNIYNQSSYVSFRRARFNKLISTRKQFEKYLKYLVKKMRKKCRNKSVLAYWTHEKNAYNFKTEMDDRGLRVYLREDSEHAQFLTKYSGVFRERWSSSTRNTVKNFFPLNNEKLREFLCMVCFIEIKKFILYGVSVYDMYELAHEYDVFILHEECKKFIKDRLSKCLTRVSNFAKFYRDEDLERAAECNGGGHSEEDNPDIGYCDRLICNNMISYFGDYHEFGIDSWINTCPTSSNLIKSEDDLLEFSTHIEMMIALRDINIPKSVPQIQSSETNAEPDLFEFYT